MCLVELKLRNRHFHNMTNNTQSPCFVSESCLLERTILAHKYSKICNTEERFNILRCSPYSLGDFLCIPTPNTGQLNPLFHTFAEFRLIVNRIVARQSTDWLAANAQFSPDGRPSIHQINYSLFRIITPH